MIVLRLTVNRKCLKGLLLLCQSRNIQTFKLLKWFISLGSPLFTKLLSGVGLVQAYQWCLRNRDVPIFKPIFFLVYSASNVCNIK